MAEQDDQFVGDMYRDPIVECGRHVLTQLDTAVEGGSLSDGTNGVTRINHYPDDRDSYWGTTTTYQAELMGGISAELLQHRQPPEYFYELLGGMVLAQIHHGNQRYSRHIPLFSPDKSEFNAHILSLWTMIPDSIRNMTDNTEYTIPIHNLDYTTLELHKPADAAMWQLLFTHRVSHVRPVFDRDDASVTLAKRFPVIFSKMLLPITRIRRQSTS